MIHWLWLILVAVMSFYVGFVTAALYVSASLNPRLEDMRKRYEEYYKNFAPFKER